MEHPFAIAALALALASPSLVTCGHAAEEKETPSRPSASDAEQEIRRLEDQSRQAALRGDTAFFERYWADDYIRTNSFGRTHDKAEALENFKSGALKYQTLEYDDVQV